MVSATHPVLCPMLGLRMRARKQWLLYLEDETFTYTVTATGMNGIASFFGDLKDWDEAEYEVGGHHRITVDRSRGLIDQV